MFEVVNCYRKFPLSKMAFQEMFIIKKCLNYLGGGAQITKSLIVRRQPPHLVCVCVCVCGGGISNLTNNLVGLVMKTSWG